MKRLLLSLFFTLVCSISTYAQTSIKFPSFHKDLTKSCSCSCGDRIVYQFLPINEENLKKWAKEAVTGSFTYGFGNYYSALKDASYYYTSDGWKKFITALKSSKNLDKMLENKIIMVAEISTPPKILRQDTDHGQQHWEIEVPIKIKYFNNKGSQEQPLVILLSVVKMAEISGIRGLGIAQLIATSKK